MRLEISFELCDSLAVVFRMETQPFISFIQFHQPQHQSILVSFPSSVVDMYGDVSCTLHSFLCMITKALFIPYIAETCLLVVEDDWRASGG